MKTALARLRAKTDQELCILIARQLHRSRKFAARGAYHDAAKDFLVSLGVSASRIDTISCGKERPVCSESTDACWATNRRSVTVVVSGVSS